ncbi:hypothetical protein TYRP_017325 [Tyrophagus putrescentiae]|nr:hypothetical protein TYRP_021902 [Tyrophagus putrescentiae]KAH9401908.1 hypothetical protein TYRP_017325 [Tyrophagus putrescentiae]
MFCLKLPEIFESKANRFSSVFITVNCTEPAIDWTTPIRQMLMRKSLVLASTCIHSGRQEPMPQLVI